jgi:outer membrane protein assembly factor BamB
LCLEGLYYYVEDQGFAACRDAATGKLIWRERLQGKYSASPVAGAGKLYCTSQAGVVTVLALGNEYKFLARNDVGELIVASPALSQGCIFLRGEKHLYCIREK